MDGSTLSEHALKYHFIVKDDMMFFDSRYFAQRYLDEIILSIDMVKDIFGSDPMNSCQKYSFAIFKREDKFCIASIQVF